MASTDSPFRIVVLSAAGIALGESSNVSSLQNQVSLDKMGKCTITLPATEPIVALINPGVIIDCYDEIDGYIGRYYYSERNKSDSSNSANVTVTCFDNLVALTRQFVGFRRAYNFVAVDQVVANLLSLAGWTGIIDSGIGNTTVDYEGESVFAAVDVLRDRWYQHYRLGDIANQMEFGAFGEDSGLLLQNLQGQVQSLFEQNRNIAHVSNINENVSADTLYNRIIPTSGGQGSEAEITIAGSLVGIYAIHAGVNQDGTFYYYIQDDASVALYGIRTKIVKFTGIHPLSNNTTDILRAIDATKYAAEAYLTQHKDPVATYSLDVIGLRANIKVGDLFHLDYRSVTNGSDGYLDADEMLFLMDITYSRDSNGSRQATLSGCTTAQRRTSDVDVMTDVVRDISVLKLHIQPEAYWSENTWQEVISSGDGVAGGYNVARPAQFKVEIDNSVMKLTKVRLRFKTFLLTGTTIGDATTGVFAPTQAQHYPTAISLSIDGIDRTTFYGGPWNPEPGNAQVDVTLDITNDIANAIGGMAQNHTIVFSCAIPAATQEMSIYVANHSNPIKMTLGAVQCNIRVQGITQGIVPV